MFKVYPPHKSRRTSRPTHKPARHQSWHHQLVRTTSRQPTTTAIRRKHTKANQLYQIQPQWHPASRDPGVQAHQQHHRTVKAREQPAVSKATRLRINQPPANQPADSHPVTSQSSQSAANQPKPDSHPTTPAHPPDGTPNHPRPAASQQQPAASHRQQAAKEPGRPV